jgi:hypothetical protein
MSLDNDFCERPFLCLILPLDWYVTFGSLVGAFFVAIFLFLLQLF